MWETNGDREVVLTDLIFSLRGDVTLGKVLFRFLSTIDDIGCLELGIFVVVADH